MKSGEIRVARWEAQMIGRAQNQKQAALATDCLDLRRRLARALRHQRMTMHAIMKEYPFGTEWKSWNGLDAERAELRQRRGR